MDEILTSTVFDHFDKTYLLDRYKGNLTGPVVRITETVHNGTRQGRYTLEVDVAVLKRIVEFIEAPIPKRPTSEPVRKRPFFTGEQCDAIKRNYLKGVPSEALAVQYGCKAKDIESVLRVEGVEIVPLETTSKRRRTRKSKYAAPKTAVQPKPTGLAAIKEEHANAYDRWTDQQDARLVKMFQDGATVERLMYVFGRQRGAISSRLRKLGY
ncbi:MAG: hypothetical protein WBO28_01795 [Flavobacteriales bacterium]